MIKFKGFVVVKDGLFYVNPKRFSKTLSKAKEFNSKGTAKKVAEKFNAEVKDLDYSR